MKSRNFEFLRETHPHLADLGAFAESYAQSDPASSLVKLRTFGEQLVAAYFDFHRLPRLPRSSFMDYLEDETFKQSAPSVVLSKLNAVRQMGNRAAHATQPVNSDHAMWILKESFDLARWFAIAVNQTEDLDAVSFVEPSPDDADTKGALKRAKKEALQKLAAQEEEMQQLLAELEDAREKIASTEPTAQQATLIQSDAEHAASALHFSEEETRRHIIDEQLRQVGWDVASGQGSTEEVGKEVEVDGQPTDSGKGFVDYVLWNDDGKPLAVIEAKKASRNAEAGRKQASLYADALEKKHGQRPIVYYTNGFEIWILDDAKAETPRKLYGFYAKESLQRRIWRTSARLELAEIHPKSTIVERPYQIEAIKRVCARFSENRQKALLVMATGTGKTRVAIALTDVLIRARWAKRVLFLCDRRELRKQAHNAYGAFLESEPRVYVSAQTAGDRHQSIYLATYPAMMKCFQDFDVGFFDLIIADESHRSIYNRYRDLFVYFDALQVGLTATPLNKVNRNTFRMFQCEEGNPTFAYEYTEAIGDHPPSLVPFRAVKVTTKFLRKGLKYYEMTREEQEKLEEQVDEPELIEYESSEIAQKVYNKDTDRHILRNLMTNGIKTGEGAHVGKTIIFARNHNHAVQLCKLFEEMYPQFMKPRQEFCAVIDNYEVRAEQLIDDFKGIGNGNKNLHIAISVDMLDTGIDVPEIVNLVFAKPLKSYVKFWQMIGRGTRLRPNLFGLGRDKQCFYIFDHFGNFEYFGENPPEVEPSQTKSLLQKVFEARIKLAEQALKRQDKPAFDLAVELLEKDVRALPMDTIAVREKYYQVEAVKQDGAIKKFDPAILSTLRNEIASLMQWRTIDGPEDAYSLDWRMAQTEAAKLEGSAQFDDFRDRVIEEVSQLPINLPQVADKLDLINRVKSLSFWDNASVIELDEARRSLRGIMHNRNRPKILKPKALELDITDSELESEEQLVKLEGLDLAAYRHRVRGVLEELFAESPALQKIKSRQPVSSEELKDLAAKVTLRDPNLKVDDLLAHYDTNSLELAIRQVVGLDPDLVAQHFNDFIQRYRNLSAHQIQFLEMMKRHIAQYGRIELEKLYEAPFTQIHNEGLDGVFSDEEQIEALINLINAFSAQGETRPPAQN